MEVHHHPDLHHKHKRLKEYLLEGFMIFIAVTLGFFAEGVREDITANKKENEYVRSFVNDLAKDFLALIWATGSCYINMLHNQSVSIRGLSVTTRP